MSATPIIPRAPQATPAKYTAGVDSQRGRGGLSDKASILNKRRRNAFYTRFSAIEAVATC